MGGTSSKDRPGKWKRRCLRVGALATCSAGVLVIVTVVPGSLTASGIVSKVQRVRVARLAAPAGPASGPAGQAMNVLITGQDRAGAAIAPSGLIMIVPISTSRREGSATVILPFAQVRVPGHGRTVIQNALVLGGPSLLVQVVSRLTGAAIQHYARIDLPHVASMIDTIGGIDVATPSGIQRFSGVTALAYTRDPALDQRGRVLRQQALILAVMRKIASERLLTNPRTMVVVLNSLAGMLTVDSGFTNSQLISLANRLGDIGATEVVP